MTPAERAELALLLEVAGAPKPGNVDRDRELGEAFESAVAGMADAAGTNTQFGCLLLLCPLVRTAATGDLTRERARDVVEATTVADAEAFFRAFEHADVAVRDPPEGAGDLDVRRGADAVPAVRERGLSLAGVLELGADRDANAREWTDGFPRVFDAAARIEAADGPLVDRAADAFLHLLAAEPDSLVATEHGDETARDVMERASELRDAPEREVRAFADDLADRGVNPGTTADLTAAALFVALERGATVTRHGGEGA